jgi:hypothetical protein
MKCNEYLVKIAAERGESCSLLYVPALLRCFSIRKGRIEGDSVISEAFAAGACLELCFS